MTSVDKELLINTNILRLFNLYFLSFRVSGHSVRMRVKGRRRGRTEALVGGQKLQPSKSLQDTIQPFTYLGIAIVILIATTIIMTYIILSIENLYYN